MTEDEAIMIFDLGVEIGEHRALRRSREVRLLVAFSAALTDGRTQDADRLRAQILQVLETEEAS